MQASILQYIRYWKGISLPSIYTPLGSLSIDQISCWGKIFQFFSEFTFGKKCGVNFGMFDKFIRLFEMS